MKSRRSFYSLLLLTSLIFSSLTPAFSQVQEDEQWLTPNRYDVGFQGILISDIVNSFQLYSRLEARSNFPTNDSTYLCKSSTSPNCDLAPNLNYNAVLGACNDKRLTDCISGFQSKNPEGKIADAVFESELNRDHVNRFQGDATLKIPDAGEPSIWDLRSAPHVGGTKYAVVSGLSGGTTRTSPTVPIEFYAYVIPVEKVNTGVLGTNQDGFSFTYPQCIAKSPGELGQARVGCRGVNSFGVGTENTKCVLNIENGPDCYIQRPFPANFSYTLNLKLKENLNGWLHGRLLDPQISISEKPGDGTNISITAKPMNVPIFYYGDSFQNLPQSLQTAYATKGGLSQGGFSGRLCCEYQPDPKLRNATSTPWSFGEDSIDEMKLWLNVAQDKSVASPSAWSVRTLSPSSISSSSRCFAQGDGLKGLVTTNSTTYSDGPPKYVDGELQYRVASPHYSASGIENRGTYNLLIRSDVAKCLYGFSDKPIQATVMVTKSDGGTSNVATELISMSDGWLKLSAKNFTFSDPTIRIKLTQEVTAPVAAATPTPSILAPTKVVPKKISITCIKGKIKKVITGTKPVCPSGYKKK